MTERHPSKIITSPKADIIVQIRQHTASFFERLRGDSIALFIILCERVGGQFDDSTRDTLRAIGLLFSASVVLGQQGEGKESLPVAFSEILGDTQKKLEIIFSQYETLEDIDSYKNEIKRELRRIINTIKISSSPGEIEAFIGKMFDFVLSQDGALTIYSELALELLEEVS